MWMSAGIAVILLHSCIFPFWDADFLSFYHDDESMGE